MKKKIAIMSWSLNAGGAERAVANLSKDLSAIYDVYIMLFDSNNIVYPYCGSILDIGILPAKTFVGKILNLFRRIFKIRYFKKKYAFDAVVSFMPQVNLYNVLTKCREKSIISIRNNMSDKGFTGFRKKMLIWCGKKSDFTVSLSNGVRDDLIDNFSYNPDKILTIYNSCELTWLLNENDYVKSLVEKFDFGRPTLVNVGRLTYQKGQWHLLRVLSVIKKTIPDCQLVIFGQGDLEEGLKKYAKKLGVFENVHFMGFVKDHHIFLQKCDAFVFSSLFEGLGNALLEALACKLPVISSNCLYGPAEILGGNVGSKNVEYAKYGVLIPAFSHSSFNEEEDLFEENDYAFARTVIDVLKNKSLMDKYRDCSFERLKSFYPTDIALQWKKIIE